MSNIHKLFLIKPIEKISLSNYIKVAFNFYRSSPSNIFQTMIDDMKLYPKTTIS
jgi:hypothetical protein